MFVLADAVIKFRCAKLAVDMDPVIGLLKVATPVNVLLPANVE